MERVTFECNFHKLISMNISLLNNYTLKYKLSLKAPKGKNKNTYTQKY